MKKIYLVDENLDEFAGKRGRPRKVKEPGGDNWYADEDEFDSPDMAGPEQIEDVELEDEVSDIALIKQLTKMLDNELTFPEFSRGSVNFKIRGSGEKIEGVPLAKLSGGEAFLFKTLTGMKKIKVEDMIIESYSGQQKFVSESFKDYE